MTHPNIGQDTIIAPATSVVTQAISLVRISGADARKICLHLLKKPIQFSHKKVSVAQLTDNGKFLDTAIITYFKNPASFTGEDTVEISCHGSPYIVSRIIELAVKYGARPAKPGEFTMRAYLNGKLNLTQAEGIAALITSQNAASHNAALNLTQGRISEELNAIKTNLIDILAQIEARLDDSDEELENISIGQVSVLLSPVIKKIEQLTSSFALGKLITEGVKVSIIGAPNCGKSSLLNCLLESDRAIISHIPGTTRDTIEESVNIGGNRFILIDTAGIRMHALNPAEKEGMIRSRRAMEKSDIILFVTDVSTVSTAKNEKLWQDISNTSKKIIKVINKCDLLKRQVKPQRNSLYISCKTQKGIKELKNLMLKSVDLKSCGQNQLIITRARHYDGLKKAAAELCKIKQKNMPLELIAEHIRNSLNELEYIVGKTTSEDVLDVIFEKFCFGK